MKVGAPFKWENCEKRKKLGRDMNSQGPGWETTQYTEGISSWNKQEQRKKKIQNKIDKSSKYVSLMKQL